MAQTASIWRWEHYFRSIAQFRAEELFQGLDSCLTPKVYLVGILDQPPDGRPGIAIVPPDAELAPTLFDRVIEDAEVIRTNDPQQDLRHSHPRAQENHERRLTMRALQQAVSERLVENVDCRDGRRSYCGPPVRVSDWGRTHFVVPVVRLDAGVVARYPALKRDVYEIHELRQARIATSLIDATVTTFLRALCIGLSTDPELASMEPTGASADELLRRSGRLLIQTAEVRTDELAIETIWNACDALAGTKYEGAETRGRLIIAPKESSDIDVRLVFSDGVSIKKHRALRKLLEITRTDDDGLLASGVEIHGVGRISLGYEGGTETVFSVEFMGDGIWELRHKNVALMRVRYGVPGLPRARVSEEEFTAALNTRLAGDIQQSDPSAVWHLAEAILGEGHGTILLVSSEAASEAQRLAGQGFVVRPELLDAELLARAAGMDGAILCDVTGSCHALGVILDGVATDRGDSARGARYNSAVRYVDSREGRCLALVISHDGMVDLIVADPAGA